MKTKLHPGTISHGTLKIDDLLCKFATTLALHNQSEHKKLIRKALDYAKVIRKRGVNDFRDGEQYSETEFVLIHNVLDELSSALNNLCPDNHYFGAHPGDGSDFGVWENEFWDNYSAWREDQEASQADERYQLEKEQEGEPS